MEGLPSVLLDEILMRACKVSKAWQGKAERAALWRFFILKQWPTLGQVVEALEKREEPGVLRKFFRDRLIAEMEEASKPRQTPDAAKKLIKKLLNWRAQHPNDELEPIPDVNDWATYRVLHELLGYTRAHQVAWPDLCLLINAFPGVIWVPQPVQQDDDCTEAVALNDGIVQEWLKVLDDTACRMLAAEQQRMRDLTLREP